MNSSYSVFNEHLPNFFVKLYSYLNFSFKSLWNLTTLSLTSLDRKQWAQVDSNHRPRAYQARALTSWAMSPQAVSTPISRLLSLSSGAFTRSLALTWPSSVKSLRFPLQFLFSELIQHTRGIRTGFSLVTFKQSTGLFEFPSGTIPFRIPSFYPKDR